MNMALENEGYLKKISCEVKKKKRIIRTSSGSESADIVLKNAVYINVFSNEFCKGDIAVTEGVIAGIGEYSGREEYDLKGKLVLPGFIDAHIHLESSLVSPREFARAVICRGTTSVVTDPHEIANVMGTDGIEYMLQATENLPLDVYFMLPSCVPATSNEESGAVLDYMDIDCFYNHARVKGLAEMMNYPGVISGDDKVMEKITAAQIHNKKIDGHAPQLKGNELNAYVSAGVYSDHECTDMQEAIEKLRRGQFIIIREGTAAKNLESLIGLISQQYYERCMLCSDDKHLNDLVAGGHIDHIIRKAVALGADPICAVKAATYNTAQYYHLDNIGAIAPGYNADFTVVDDLKRLNVKMVFKNGVLWYNEGKLRDFDVPLIDAKLVDKAHDTFNVRKLEGNDFQDNNSHAVISIAEESVLTSNYGYAENIDLDGDILKIAVIERHKGTGHIGLGYVHGYGMKRGAVATSIAHDSHNIIVVGTNVSDMALAANTVVENKGGITVACEGKVCAEVILEIAGIMSDAPLEKVNEALKKAKDIAYEFGVNRKIDPFMTLSFIALPVIPDLRITTHGIIDVNTQKYI